MNLIEVIEAQKDELVIEYKARLRRRLEMIKEDMGPALRGVYNSSRWAREWSGFIRSNTDTVYAEGLENRPHGAIDHIVNEAALKRNAEHFADMQIDAWKNKLLEKVDNLDNISCTQLDRCDFVVNGDNKNGDRVVINQQAVFKFSKLGTPFYQFPARIKVNGKAMSEKQYKEYMGVEFEEATPEAKKFVNELIREAEQARGNRAYGPEVTKEIKGHKVSCSVSCWSYQSRKTLKLDGKRAARDAIEIAIS